jgi:MoaA/NifB/PqqE/SkfB family radical SAM enzyme
MQLVSGIEMPAADLAIRDQLRRCYPTEYASEGTFVWTRGRFQLCAPRDARFAALKLGYLGQQGAIRLLHDGVLVDHCDLKKGWQTCALRLPANIDWLTLEIDPIPVVESDERELGVMLRAILFFNEEQVFSRLRETSRNAVLNDGEFRQGLSILDSYPPNLRITTETRCNIPETSQACTYCAWDWAKEMETGAPAFDVDTLDQLGGFYRNAEKVGDCSIGEPTMNKQFSEIITRFENDGKKFSFTTNGQLVSRVRRRALLGKDIEVYVSIDAATSEGFKRYRNEQFDRIISNLRLLCEEKREHANLPKVIASFIAMRSNADELSAYLGLMKNVGVDEVKLRTLYLDDNVLSSVTNNGYRFDYASEILSAAALHDLGERARRIAADLDLPLYVEWDQFEPDSLRESSEPLCAEPWKTLYVLARGIMPCCYATEPLAKWEDQGDRSLDQFLQDTFNSPEYQELRNELAGGRLAKYCRDTPSCPILKRMNDESNDIRDVAASNRISPAAPTV